MIVVMNIKKSQIFLHSLEGKKNYQPGTPESNWNMHEISNVHDINQVKFYLILDRLKHIILCCREP